MSGAIAALLAAAIVSSDPAAAAAPVAEAPAAEIPPAAAPAAAAADQAVSPPAADAPAPAVQAAPAPSGGPVVAYTERPMAMTFMTPGKAAFGMLGAAAMIGESKRIVREYDIRDPSAALSRELAEGLAKARGLGLAAAAAPGPQKKGEAIPAVAADGTRLAYVVDVQTVYVLVSYYSFDWAHYQAKYSAKLVVSDPSSGKVVLKKGCSASTPKEGAPTHDELLADGATLMKDLIGQAGAVCLEQFRTDLAALPA